MPRIEYWYHVNSSLGKLSLRYRRMSLIDIYRDPKCVLEILHELLHRERGEGDL